MNHLRFIQLRDKDALILLNTRDYELIELSLKRHILKLDLKMFFTHDFPMKASRYRKYSQAYFEEILINNEVDSRIAVDF